SGNTSKFRIGDDIFPTLLLLDLTCPGEQRIEIAVFFQQLRGRLWTNAELARISRQLVALRTDVPLDQPLEALVLEPQ
ncbi:hypothetical protein PS027_23655, partial [Shigella sonnei]|nr:hypothetical protein [Shigella sonnei]